MEIVLEEELGKYRASDVVWKVMQAENVNFAWERILLTVLRLQKVEPAKQAKVMQEFQKQSAQINMTVSPNQVPVQVCVLNMCQVHYFRVMMLGWSEPYVSQCFTLHNE
jgi:hypothetical protein